MNLDPQWVTAVAASIGCISLGLVVWQVKVNHDKDRRLKALEVLKDFGEGITNNSFRYAGFMFALPTDCVKMIQKGHSVCVERQLVALWLPEVAEKSQGDKIELGVDLVLDIRITMVNILNRIELVALAYKHGVADKRIIYECFSDLLIKDNFLNNCHKFIEPFGGGWDCLAELPALMNMPKARTPSA